MKLNKQLICKSQVKEPRSNYTDFEYFLSRYIIFLLGCILCTVPSTAGLNSECYLRADIQLRKYDF